MHISIRFSAVSNPFILPKCHEYSHPLLWATILQLFVCEHTKQQVSISCTQRTLLCNIYDRMSEPSIALRSYTASLFYIAAYFVSVCIGISRTSLHHTENAVSYRMYTTPYTV